MSNLIPPLLSSTPPPIDEPVDDDDDEFGDFRAASDSFGCVGSSPHAPITFTFDGDLSLPPTPEKEVPPDLKPNHSTHSDDAVTTVIDKDFKDRRKDATCNGQSEECNDNLDCSSIESVVDDLGHTQPEESSSGADDVQENYTAELELPEEIYIIENSAVESDSVDIVESASVNIAPQSFTQNEVQVNLNCDNENSALDLTNLQTLDPQLPVILQTNDDRASDASDFDDDFGNFETHFDDNNISGNLDQPEPLQPPCSEVKVSPDVDVDSPLQSPCGEVKVSPDVDDDFGDFKSPEFATDPENDGEDFCDFVDDFQSALNTPVLLEIDVKDVLGTSEKILREVFATCQDGQEETDKEDFNSAVTATDNEIFDALKDMTETNALTYQWSKSESQKLLLKALNIDLRNILYGPAWNCSMPRFAANLTMAPLEPVKSDIQLKNSSHKGQSNGGNGDIPSAQFDWSGAGLVNPLNSTESTEQSKEAPQSNDLFLTSLSRTLTPTSPSLEPPTQMYLATIPPEPLQLTKNHLESLPGVSEETPSFPSPTIIPLRETHISSDKSVEVLANLEDEFDDFQMVLPARTDLVIDDFRLLNDNAMKIDLNSLAVPDIKCEVNAVTEDDDEFTDFHSPAPPTNMIAPIPSVPLEPIKPAITPMIKQPTQINWPEPGVTDEDIRRIEMIYSRKTPAVEESQIVMSSPAKSSSAKDDDEWSDFVSVNTTAAPATPKRTATPDLALSVLNLNHVQPAKAPIPVVTAAGLIQTKLSSNSKTSPKASNVVQTSMPLNQTYKPQPMHFQPSIISNHQFVADPMKSPMFANNGSIVGVRKPPNLANYQPAKSASLDDDEWTDFVSGQLPPQQTPPNKPVNLPRPPPQIATWSTNIIMNPSHFHHHHHHHRRRDDATGPENRAASTVQQSKKNSIPSISAMPDLDFIAPKSRTHRK